MNFPIKVSLPIASIVAIFILYVFYDIHSQLETNIKQSANKKILRETNKIYKEIDYEINSLKMNLSLMSMFNNDIINDNKTKSNKISFFLKSIPFAKEIVLIPYNNPDNYTIISKESTYTDKNNINSIMLKKDDIINKGMLVTGFYYNKNNELMIDMYANVRDVNTNKSLATIILRSSLKRLQDQLSSKLLEFDAISILDLNNNNFIYKSTKAKKININNFLKSHDNIFETKEKTNPFIISSVDYKKDNLNIRVSLITAKHRHYKELNQILQENIFKLILIVIILTIVLYLIVKRILNPLRVLTVELKEKSYKLDHNIVKKENSSMDEVQLLDHYFNIFIQLIENKNKQLRDFNSTLQKKIYEEVKKNNEKQKYLMHQSRLAQMGEMLSMIAHQWRQPLAAISSTTNSLLLKSM
ncbi:MAG: hypothetical protein U9Q33_05800, partial [Campylobacterota bacterium]|nr:hypothetical protein [Campylobacterota bacterium]